MLAHQKRQLFYGGSPKGRMRLGKSSVPTGGNRSIRSTHQAVISPPRLGARAHVCKSWWSRHPNVRAALALCVCLRPPRANA